MDEASRGLELFRWRYWRCEAFDRTGTKRCRNYGIGHSKGHQFDVDLMDTSSIPAVQYVEDGTHKCSWEPKRFTDQLWREANKLRSSGQATARFCTLAKTTGIMKVYCQRTCLVCLSNHPTNKLPCQGTQHAICEGCIRRYAGQDNNSAFIRLISCPLGCKLTRPWTIRIKPKTAGPRILALDGWVLLFSYVVANPIFSTLTIIVEGYGVSWSCRF